jgi:hypothetical protein
MMILIQIQKTRVPMRAKPKNSQHRMQPLEVEAAEVVADVVDAVAAEGVEEEEEEVAQEVV